MIHIKELHPYSVKYYQSGQVLQDDLNERIWYLAKASLK